MRMPRGRAPIRFQVMPTPRPRVQTGNPFDIFQKVDEALRELRMMHRDFTEGVNLVKHVAENFDKIKTGKAGAPGLPGTPGAPGKSVTAEMVAAEVQRLYKPPADGVAPTVEEVAAQVLSSPKFMRYVRKNLPKTQNVKAPDAETLIEEVIRTIKEKGLLQIQHVMGLDGKFREVYNRLAGNIYGKDTWARGGGDTVEAGSNVTITETVDGRKRISSTGGGGNGYQAPTSGTVDGVNQTFVWASAPNVIVVDQGRPMQKTSSDGTANWTGTTTTVLTIAPTFDIFATA